MTPSINPNISSLRQLSLPEKISGSKAPSEQVDFQKMLMGTLQETSRLGHVAEQNIETRLMGGEITSAEVYTSMRKADLALKMLMQVRNKLVSAYQEVQQMRM